MRIVRGIPFLVLASFLLVWLGKGAHLGITRDFVAVPVPDPVTGIEGFRMEPVWIPGLDFLAAGFGLAGVLFVIRIIPWSRWWNRTGKETHED